MNAYIQTKQTRPDGTADSFHTEKVECKFVPLWWQDRGLQFTASGYGRRIPTTHMVKYNGRWRRVYCCIFSNIGTLYIGKLNGEQTLRVNLET